MGAGSYRHHIPAIVSRLAGRSEYMTSYTPYQPEVSQGTLQTEYEFQTLCSQLTGMEVANAGMYDGSTSLAEGALMAARVTRRDKIAVLDTVSQRFIEVLHTYTRSQGITVEVGSSNDTEISEGTAALIVQTPNFYGYIEDVDRYSKLIHDKGGLFVVYVDPVSLGMFKPPSDYDADIVAAEGHLTEADLSFAEELIWIPEEESYAANTIAYGDRIIIAGGYKKSRQLMLDAGFSVTTVEMGEFREVDASLTCLSVFIG